MRLLSLLVALPAITSFVGANPILEARQPASCALYCYFSGTIETKDGKNSFEIETFPGCSTCPGHNCTGKARGELDPPGTDLRLIGDYWVRAMHVAARPIADVAVLHSIASRSFDDILLVRSCCMRFSSHE